MRRVEEIVEVELEVVEALARWDERINLVFGNWIARIGVVHRRFSIENLGASSMIHYKFVKRVGVGSDNFRWRLYLLGAYCIHQLHDSYLHKTRISLSRPLLLLPSTFG